MLKRNSHCSYCGTAFATDLAWPRTCANCNNISYINPIPVTVVVLPIDNGLLVVRRNIEPRRGYLALPGGYVNFGETWQQAGARELFEETGVVIMSDELSLIDIHSTPHGQILIFAKAHARRWADLPPFEPNDETQEVIVLQHPTELAFPMHTAIANRFFTMQP
ncbi:MAG: NUDIX domain-containing protein [Anaerolineae bacterium]|nr:NUDIX domain-containing protein [Anaerolineae bacterium]